MNWDDFEVLGRLGQGNMGHVYKCRYDGHLFAVKVYIKGKDLKSVEAAMKIAKRLKHPNLLRCYDYFHDDVYLPEIADDRFDTIVSVMELIEGEITPFSSIAQPQREEKLTTHLPSICSALKYLHKNGIIHRDLKPDNLVLIKTKTDKGIEETAKIIDLDFLTEKNSKIAGTPYYISPEMFSEGEYGTKTDLWSLGVSIYYLLTRDRPFKGKDKDDLKENIISGPLPDFSILPEKFQPIVKGLLNRDEYKRFTCGDVIKGLK